jgi:hypothetical protein
MEPTLVRSPAMYVPAHVTADVDGVIAGWIELGDPTNATAVRARARQPTLNFNAEVIRFRMTSALK